MQDYIHVFLYIPAIIMALWACDEKARMKQWRRLTGTIMLIVIFTINVLHRSFLYAGMDMPFLLEQANYVGVALIVPISYLYINYSCGLSPKSWGVSAIYACLILLFIPNLNVHLGGDMEQAQQIQETLPQHINFFMDGALVYSIRVVDMIQLIQTSITFIYLLYMAQRIVKYQLKLTKKAIIFLSWWLGTVVFLILLIALPDSIDQVRPFNYVFFPFDAILITGLFYQTSHNYDTAPLITLQGETIESNLEAFIVKHKDLAAQARLLLVNDELYKNANISIDDVAARLGTNRSYLARVMKAEFGATFADYIAQQRIAYAKELMLSTDKLLDEIAQLSGFKETTTFTRAFKRIENNETPDRWRRAQKGRKKGDFKNPS